MVWHDNSGIRHTIGTMAEELFRKAWRCECGGQFVKYAVKAGDPDCQCTRCGQKVEVKDVPNVAHYNVSVSATPWERYDADCIIAVLWRDEWWAQWRCNLTATTTRPRPPTHIGPDATDYYLVAMSQFEPAEVFFKRRVI